MGYDGIKGVEAWRQGLESEFSHGVLLLATGVSSPRAGVHTIAWAPESMEREFKGAFSFRGFRVLSFLRAEFPGAPWGPCR